MEPKHALPGGGTGRRDDVPFCGSIARRLCRCLPAVLLALPAVAQAGAWVQRDGDTLLILKYLHSEGDEQFDDGHHRVDFPDHGHSRQEQLNLYLEHGLSERLSLIGNFYLSQVGYRNDYASQRTTGAADQEIGLRYALPAASGAAWQHALQGLLSFPGYDRDDRPALGLGDYGLELRYSVGRGYRVGTRSGYLDIGAALRLRGADAADEARLDVTGGVALGRGWMLLGELNLIQGLGNGRGSNPVNFIQSTNYDLTKAQLSLMHGAGRMQWQFGYQQPLMGRNTGVAGGPFLAAWWRF